MRLGQFYTPEAVAAFMVEMAGGDTARSVCEPGHGQGVFLDALARAGFHDVTAYDVDEGNHADVIGRLAPGHKALLGDYLRTPRDEAFDLIIGNPPYVHWNNIDPETKEALEGPFWKGLANGEWDLLYAFIVWSVERLRAGGELILIVPYGWLNSTHAASLRSYLATHGSFEQIVHFSEHKLFPDCSPNAIIFKYRKVAKNEDTKAMTCVKIAEFEGTRGSLDELLDAARRGLASLGAGGTSEHEEGEWRFFTARHFEAEGTWGLASPSDEEAAGRLEVAGMVPVGSLFEVGVGLASGLDAAFSLNEEGWGALSEADREVVQEFAGPPCCERYSLGPALRAILADAVGSEDELRRRHPGVHAHLLPYKGRLLRRYGAREDAWWHWATPRNVGLFERHLHEPKLFVPGIDRAPQARFSITSEPLYGRGDIVCVARGAAREDMLYALGWLNSSLVGDWYRIRGARNGHRKRYTQAYVAKIPYRPIDPSDAREAAVHEEVVAATRLAVASPPGCEARAQAEARIDAAFEELLSL